MVVWVFAGGGHTELKGLINFLKRNFPEHHFIRYTPIIQKRGPKPGKSLRYKSLGKTGADLAEQIRHVLASALQESACDLILILDDLDCRDEISAAKIFEDTLGNIQEAENIHHFIGFSAPEIESWLIADWQHTFAADYKFKSFHKGLQYCLSVDYKVSLENPESFSKINPDTDACYEKLSQIIIEAVQLQSEKCKKKLLHFSKREHSPDLLMLANAHVIQRKCPIFSKLYRCLKLD